MKLKRIISLLLCLCMLVPATACGSDSESNSDTQTQTESTSSESETSANDESSADSTAETEDPRLNYKDSLPEGLDFGGSEYRILCRENAFSTSTALSSTEMHSEELTGEVVNDAIYSRSLAVEDRLNVDIQSVLAADVNTMVKSSIAANDNAFDIVAGYAYFITPLALDGMFMNLADTKYIDYSQPWWPSKLIDDLTIQNQLYFISGEIALSYVRCLNCLLFNRTLAENWGIPDLYQLVRDGKWTFDKYMEVSRMVSSDANGDSKYDENDIYGLANLSVDSFFSSFDIEMTKTNDDGTISISMYNDKFIDVYSRMYDFMHENCVFPMKLALANWPIPERTLFQNDQALIWGTRFDSCEELRDMESDFGIIPNPKYDEAQTEYYTIPHDEFSLMCVPVTAADSMDMISAVTEALAAESYRSVTSVYIDTALKSKYSRDPQSREMIDIIMNGSRFQVALLYSNCLGDLAQYFRNIFNDVEDITSFYTKNEKRYIKLFDQFNEAFSEMAE